MIATPPFLAAFVLDSRAVEIIRRVVRVVERLKLPMIARFAVAGVFVRNLF